MSEFPYQQNQKHTHRIVDKEGHVLEEWSEPAAPGDWRLESRTTWVADGRLWESVIRSKEAK